MEGYYEHHLTIKKDKLCPFKVGMSINSHDVQCNWHENIEILLITEGNGMMQYGKDTFPLSTHDIIIVNSGELHRPFSEIGISYYYIIIDVSFCKENGIDMSHHHFNKKLRDEQTERLILDVTERMEDYSNLSSSLSAARLRGAMLSLLIDVCTRHVDANRTDDERTTPSEEYVKHVLHYLKDYYTQPISLDSLAALCGITKFHLSREFKKYTGQTIFTHINILRCRQAEILLSEGKTVTEAALETGFESLSYFSRTYKRLIGTPPSKSK